ncbi:receptor-like protein 12 [Setaria italica]|nr:receptor-like protein 12 [Setaria italica]
MPIPEFMGYLKSLTTYLDLSNMNLSGQVPPQLGNLTKLKYLNINVSYSLYNQYSYASDVSWLANLHSLEHLDMSTVDLSAAVDWVHWVNTLPNLRVLDLSNCELNSSIPSLLHKNLTVLENLDLSLNSFQSPAAPNWYWDVTSLKSLNLAASGLLGPFPDELGNLTKLRNLAMESNEIQGMIPSTLNRMCSLQNIYLSQINIGGDIAHLMDRIPKCSLNSLQELFLDRTNITGTIIESVSNFTALSILDISYNHLSGSLPVEIGTLKNLTELIIPGNGFSGVISEEHFSGLTNLKYIDLTDTHLQVMVGSDWEPPFDLHTAYLSSCYLGQIPNWLRWQKSISYLNISDTGLIGTIPDWFWNTFSNATSLDLSYNQLSGKLPLDLEFMSSTVLLLQSNNLTGSVPRLPRSIYLLDISKNSLNGQLPSNFGGPNLQVAVLFSNRITGIIPDSVCRSPQLQILDLSNNLLTRGLPDCDREGLKQQNQSRSNSSRVGFGSAHSYSLKISALLLNNNCLSGGFPLFLKQCQDLGYLDLSQNRFSGKLPAWISDNMPKLVMLRLRSNYFSGHIPIETTRLSYLRIFDLANNTFSGVIPQSLANLQDLTTTEDVDPFNPFVELYQSGNFLYYMGMSGDSFSLATKGQVLQYNGNAVFFKSIDLSYNRLVGKIPEEIGSLLGLINLDLSSNFINGSIPYKICNLQGLESLDLSNNQLSGEIPWCLSNLTSLSYLNLSYNNLSGRIPSGHQLDTLRADDPTSMYIGNPGLCGRPLPKVCPGDQPPVQRDPVISHEDDKAQIDFHLGLIMGFLVGLWIIFCGLLFKKTWRYAYFSLFDKLYDVLCLFCSHLSTMVHKGSSKLIELYKG